MKKIILYLFLFVFLVFFTFIYYFSYIGIETKSFNNKIKNNITKIDKNLSIVIDTVQLRLNVKKLNIEAIILNPKINYKNETIEIENIKSLISIRSAINREFAINNLDISTKSVKIKKIFGLIRIINNSPEIYILQNQIRDGNLIADIKINFDKNGKIKKDFEINGYVKDGQLNLLDDYKLNELNFLFKIKDNIFELKDIKLLIDEFDFSSTRISLINKTDHFYIKGNLKNNNLEFNEKKIKNILNLLSQNSSVKKIIFSSENSFSFQIDNKFKISKLNLISKIKLKDLIFENKKKGKYFFPEISDYIFLKNDNLKINYKNDEFFVDGFGDLLIQKKIDRITYSMNNKGKFFQLNSHIELNQNPFNLKFLDYKKENKSISSIKSEFFLDKDKNINIKNIEIKEKDNRFIIKNIFLDKNFKIIKIDKIDLDYIDTNKRKNSIKILRDENTYNLEGTKFNANRLITRILDSDDNKNNFFKKDFDLNINLDHIYLDDKNSLKNLVGSLKMINNNVKFANISSSFSKDKKFILSIRFEDNEKITNLFSGKAHPLVNRYKFIKGFEEGTLEFNSKKINGVSTSNLKIYDFKLQELPALTKLLSLASLQGIADTLTGEGIRFNELEMNFTNKNNTITINELYAIGPAISILMNGYVEEEKLVSLRGTLVPATTINKTIGSIPLLGKILVGSKVGEGVFGVSFKIKGHPKNLETKVNPIKTLTPRFITRTLEKIKKTN